MFSKKPQVSAISAAVYVALSAFAAHAQAQGNQLDRVEITGSSIKRSINDEGALPITVMKVEDLRQSGVTSVEGVIALLSSSQSNTSSVNSIGSGTGGATYASMRGLGPERTLILLNGRRVAAFAFSSAAVDLNSIPFAVVDRVEVLRDGASAIYGTDAIGGVINFITKTNFRGGQISAEVSRPSGAGGDKEGGSVTFGMGDLDKDGVNFWATADYRRTQRVRALDRDFARTGIIPSKGVNGNSPTTFPGNFTQNSTGVSGNLTAPACAAPLSVPNPNDPKVCVFDFSATIDIIPDVSQRTFASRTTLKLAGDNVASLELMANDNRNVARVAQDPVSGITIAPTNPFYPHGYPGLDETKAVTAAWRMVPAGNRTNESISNATRAVFDLTGSYAGYDYKGGLFWTESTASDAAIDGYVNAPFVRAQVAAGNITPFAAATPAQLAIIEQAKRKGVFAQATGSTRGVDFRVSRELFDMGGGKAAFSLGGELREEFYKNDSNDDVVLAIPSAGRSVNHVAGNRKVKALGGELLLPLTKTLELQLALRSDNYSDAGTTTNPKVGFRFQPMTEVLLRGSYNTGFRAPSLDDMYGPQTITFATSASDDPLLCPKGVVDLSKGGVKSRDCANQPQVQQGGNPNLKPEKSKTFSFGLAIEPIKNLTFSVDYWNIKLRDQIAPFPQDSVVNDPVKYANRYIRCKDVSVAVQANINRCLADNLNSNAIAYLITLTDNLGSVNTNGLDFSAAYTTKLGSLGNFAFAYEGTYVNKYEYQNSPDDVFKQNVGVYSDGSPVFRWKHNASLGWNLGMWSSRLGVRHQSGYRDHNAPATVVGGASFYGDVGSYTLVDLSVSAKLLKGVGVTVGVKNLFDTDPPFSNQSTRSQRGYDPRYTDPMGRTLFVRGSYTF
nr:TonB-dependent receptor [uncultured Roseateles sp.]